MRNLLYKIRQRLLVGKSYSDSELNHLFIQNMKKKGISIGNNNFFREVKSISIDQTRPSLITIGDNNDINCNFRILTHDYGTHVFREVYSEFINSSGKVTIGNNNVFGMNITILKGVTIGDNNIIALGSIITKDIPSK